MKGVVITAGIILSLVTFTSYKVLTDNAKNKPKSEAKSIVLNADSQETNGVSESAELEIVPTDTPTPTPTFIPSPTQEPLITIDDPIFKGKKYECTVLKAAQVREELAKLNMRKANSDSCSNRKQEFYEQCKKDCDTGNNSSSPNYQSDINNCYNSCNSKAYSQSCNNSANSSMESDMENLNNLVKDCHQLSN